MINQSLFSSKKQDWCTPQDLFEELDAEFHFVLDAAADNDNHKCEKYYTEKTDGLSNSWDFGGTVFCNPPYGKELGNWVEKAHDEWQRGVSSVLLIPARTDTSYFHDYIYHIAGIRFLRVRLKFTYSDGQIIGSAPFPSMLVIYK